MVIAHGIGPAKNNNDVNGTGEAVHASATLRDYERLAARSEQMAPVLLGLAERGRHAKSHDELARVVAEANHVMAQENYDWWVSLSGQTPLMPV